MFISTSGLHSLMTLSNSRGLARRPVAEPLQGRKGAEVGIVREEEEEG